MQSFHYLIKIEQLGVETFYDDDGRTTEAGYTGYTISSACGHSAREQLRFLEKGDNSAKYLQTFAKS